MTRLWLGVAVGNSEAPLPCAWLAGGQVCFFGCKGSDGTCSLVHDVVGHQEHEQPGHGVPSSGVPSSGVPTAL